MKVTPVDVWIIEPVKRFINNSTTGGIVLFVSAVIALVLANSPWHEAYHHFWETEFTIAFGDFEIRKDLHHWINDGLMAVFFFVVGLELKREVLAGELSNPKDAILPMMAGLGGMLFPALIYFVFNSTGESSAGWGIPMATDIAFALGIMYLLGDKVPTSLKVFLTALAIADDLGAVLVIALFYTSDVSLFSLGVGTLFMAVLIGANLAGVRSTLFYGIVGIAGLWTAFLLSGIHATVAGVLAALTIPADVKIDDLQFSEKMRALLRKFDMAEKNNVSLVTEEQLHVLGKMRSLSVQALTPLQRLEHGMHPLVAFVVMPIFALANAGITFSGNFSEAIFSTVSLGIIAGLLFGKFIGIVAFSKLMIRFNWATLPSQVTWKHIYGTACLASVGFTMSLFITELAFKNPTLVLEAKVGILIASLIGGGIGYLLLAQTKPSDE